jgi:hypothetical protein
VVAVPNANHSGLEAATVMGGVRTVTWSARDDSRSRPVHGCSAVNRQRAFQIVGRRHHPHMAPLCVNRKSFPPVEDAPVLAVVKQRALDGGCGSALVQGVGNGRRNGLPGG